MGTAAAGWGAGAGAVRCVWAAAVEEGLTRRVRFEGRSSSAVEMEVSEVMTSASELEVTPEGPVVGRFLKRELLWFWGFRSVFGTKLAPRGM